MSLLSTCIEECNSPTCEYNGAGYPWAVKLGQGSRHLRNECRTRSFLDFPDDGDSGLSEDEASIRNLELVEYPDSLPHVNASRSVVPILISSRPSYGMLPIKADSMRNGPFWDLRRFAPPEASASFVTAPSTMTTNTYDSAISTFSSREDSMPFALHEDHAYAKLLRTHKLWPVGPDEELNWSGRGQHADFGLHERPLLNEILTYEETLGIASTATVQSVKCRRILLARKTIICNKRHRMTRAEAIGEVAHLSRLKHAHILRMIGTYVIGFELSILLYPVAQDNLATFLDSIQDAVDAPSAFESRSIVVRKVDATRKFFACLSGAVCYIHSQLTKHMDIKPQNILVREGLDRRFQIYIGDFGVARSYQDTQDIVTDGPTSFTRKYAAPEVLQQDLRGLSADIFSLGCVFIEMIETVQYFYTCADQKNNPPAEHNRLAQQLIQSREITSYEASIDSMQQHLKNLFQQREKSSGRSKPSPCHSWPAVISDGERFLVEEKTLTNRMTRLIACMIHVIPENRPVAEELQAYLGVLSCCRAGQVSLEAQQDAMAE